MKKNLIIASAATAVGLAGLTGAGFAYAATNTANNTNPMDSLVSAVATKFNLNKDEVQKVFDEQHTAMEQERENEIKDELAQAVKDGKLTQAQSDAITAKRAELQKEREANRTSDQSKSRDEMKSAMDTKRTELEAWAKEQGIDTQYLRFVFGHGGRGHGGPDGMRDGDKQQDSSTGSSTSSSTNKS